MPEIKKPIIGMITLGDPREHEWNNMFKKLAGENHLKMLKLLENIPVEVKYCDELPRNIPAIKEQANQLKAQGAEMFLLHVASWIWPNFATTVVQAMDLPTVLWANRDPGSHSTVGLLGAGGALNQIGYPHTRVQCPYEGEETMAKLNNILLPKARAAAAVSRLRGSVFGLFGGRSLGIETGTFDPMQWKKCFGIDSDHVDQLEIVRRAHIMEDARIDKMQKWLADNSKSLTYGEKFTEERFRFQIACYLATKDIIEESGIDFAAIKCMPDMTRYHTPQCITAAFLNDRFDAEGEKEATVMACESDADAALTMQMMKLVTGGMPTMFADVSHLDPASSIIYLPNCGAYTAWFAGRSNDPYENLAKIDLREANRPAGGSITLFTTAPGPVTLARLTRMAGEYRMYIIKGEMVTPEPERAEEFAKSRGKHQLPTAYIKANIDYEKLVNEFDSNHIAGVGVDCVDSLVAACEILGIPVTVDG